MNYLDQLKSNKSDPYFQDLLNTAYDFLPHKRELLNSELSKNRFSLKQQTLDDLSEHLQLFEQKTKFTSEFEKILQIANSFEKEFLPKKEEEKSYEQTTEVIEKKKFKSYSEFFYLIDVDKSVRIAFDRNDFAAIQKLLEIFPDKGKWIKNYILNISEIILERITEMKTEFKKNENLPKILELVLKESKISYSQLVNLEITKRIALKNKKIKRNMSNDEIMSRVIYNVMTSVSKIKDKYPNKEIDLICKKNIENFLKKIKQVSSKSIQEENFQKILFWIKEEKIPYYSFLDSTLNKELKKIIYQFEGKMESFVRIQTANNNLMSLAKLEPDYIEKLKDSSDKLSLIKRNDLLYFYYVDQLSLKMLLERILGQERKIEFHNIYIKPILDSLPKKFDEFYRRKMYFMKEEELIRITTLLSGYFLYLESII